jgi:anti-anti-sigma regulatory factor
MKIKEDKFTIQTIKKIYLKLLKEYNTTDKIKINFINIDEIDISAIQLLVSLKQSCKKNNKILQINNLKDEIIHALKLAGVTNILEVPDG